MTHLEPSHLDACVPHDDGGNVLSLIHRRTANDARVCDDTARTDAIADIEGVVTWEAPVVKRRRESLLEVRVGFVEFGKFADDLTGHMLVVELG